MSSPGEFDQAAASERALKFEQDRQAKADALHKEVSAKPLVPANHPNPKVALHQIAHNLSQIRKIQRRGVAMTDALWEQYLRDCKTHGVEPMKEEP